MIGFLKKHFLTGLLAITPVAFTAWILWQFYLLISNTMRPVIRIIDSRRVSESRGL